MNDCFAQKKEYDVNQFRIVDEGLPKNLYQLNFIYRESAIHGSSIVATPSVRHPKTLNLHSDSCAGQENKVMGYFMILVELCWQNPIFGTS